MPEINGGTWIQKYSQIVSICQDIEFEKKPSKFYIPEQLQHLRILDDDHTKSLYSPSNLILLPKKQNTIAPKLPERIHSVPKRKYSEPAPRKFARFEKKSKS